MIHLFVICRRENSESKSSLARLRSKESSAISGASGMIEKEAVSRPASPTKRASFTPLGQNEREAGYSYGYSEASDDEDQDDGDLANAFHNRQDTKMLTPTQLPRHGRTYNTRNTFEHHLYSGAFESESAPGGHSTSITVTPGSPQPDSARRSNRRKSRAESRGRPSDRVESMMAGRDVAMSGQPGMISRTMLLASAASPHDDPCEWCLDPIQRFPAHVLIS